jgi:hypothetical protein
MTERKPRIPIPDDVAADALFRSDRTCCVCHKSGRQVQIHHINDNPADNDPVNLAVLCLECHAQTQLTGGFGRKLNAKLVTLYRDHWLDVIEMRRAAEILDSELAKELNTTSPELKGVSLPTKVGIGSTFRHLGIALTVIDVGCSFNVRLNNSKYRTGSGRETYEDVAAGDGAKYVSVKMRVHNESKKPLDLTCGYPIKNYLTDDRYREFTSIGEKYRIQGNPGCNEKLQPGFSNDMTYIYRVPLDANISAFMFEDATDSNRDRTIKATRIPLVVPAPR